MEVLVNGDLCVADIGGTMYVCLVVGCVVECDNDETMTYTGVLSFNTVYIYRYYDLVVVNSLELYGTDQVSAMAGVLCVDGVPESNIVAVRE